MGEGKMSPQDEKGRHFGEQYFIPFAILTVICFLVGASCQEKMVRRNLNRAEYVELRDYLYLRSAPDPSPELIWLMPPISSCRPIPFRLRVEIANRGAQDFNGGGLSLIVFDANHTALDTVSAPIPAVEHDSTCVLSMVADAPARTVKSCEWLVKSHTAASNARLTRP
jgi:hypothetical protein